jgi:hypothetical protein
MAVGKVGGGGRKGGPSGPKGAGGTRKSGDSFTGKVGQAGPTTPGKIDTAAPLDPITSFALEISRQLRSGEIASREEATRRLVDKLLKEKVRMQSKALTKRIADFLQDDPRINPVLERLWSRSE